MEKPPCFYAVTADADCTIRLLRIFTDEFLNPMILAERTYGKANLRKSRTIASKFRVPRDRQISYYLAVGSVLSFFRAGTKAKASIQKSLRMDIEELEDLGEVLGLFARFEDAESHAVKMCACPAAPRWGEQVMRLTVEALNSFVSHPSVADDTRMDYRLPPFIWPSFKAQSGA